MNSKICTLCKIEKSINNFSPKSDGYQSHCKECKKKEGSKIYAKKIKKCPKCNNNKKNIIYNNRNISYCPICSPTRVMEEKERRQYYMYTNLSKKFKDFKIKNID